MRRVGVRRIALAALVATALLPAAAEARPGVDVPRPDALVERLPVRVVVTPPARASALRIHLGSRDVTRRFQRVGSQLVGRLTRGDGLRFGHNQVSVLTGRGRTLRVIDASTFVLARRVNGIARLELRRGTVISLNLAGASNRRHRTVRAWLNGRPITRALHTPRAGRWTAQLSATHGLRHGINRLRILVVEGSAGRSALLERRFEVSANRLLPGAGWDRAARARARVRLDGRGARAPEGQRLEHRWRVVSKPRGSRALLRSARSSRPVLIPDRPGRYVVAQRVARRGGTALSRADTVTVTTAPDQLLVPFKGMTADTDKRSAIKVGDQTYRNMSPGGTSIQWLTLDRATLRPTGDGNSWLDGSASGPHSVSHFKSQVRNGNREQLVALAFPYTPNGDQPIPTAQFPDFADVLHDRLRVPFSQGQLIAALFEGNTFSVVGVPVSPTPDNEGIGWAVLGNTNIEALTGWLMPSTDFSETDAPLFRLQPDRPKYDTSLSKTATSNTMLLGDQRFDASLPAGATGGFQVVTFDPLFLTPSNRRVFATNGVPDGEGQLHDMALYLDVVLNQDQHVAVQSIGTVAPSTPPARIPVNERDFFGWYRVATALSKLGANPHTFNTVNGSYAFIGGPSLDQDEGADSSSAVALDSVRKESGTVRGRLTLRHDGIYAPLVADTTDALEFALYDYIFRPATPWPYTTGPQADDYARALAYITRSLPDTRTWAPDLRQAYAQADGLDWSDSLSKLIALPYPGDGRTCNLGPGPQRSGLSLGFNRDQFCALSAQLQLEFDYLDATQKDVFVHYESLLNTTAPGRLVDLERIGKEIHDDVQAPDDAAIGWSLGGFAGNGISAGLVLNPTVEPLAAWEGLVVVFELVRELTEDKTHGEPVSEQVETKVEDLTKDLQNKVSEGAVALPGLRDVIISDWGRLQAFGSVAASREWAVRDGPVAERLRKTARASFSSALMPVAYGVYALQDYGTPEILMDPNNCDSFVHPNEWKGTPASSQIAWMGNFSRDNRQGWWPTRLVLGKHTLGVTGSPYPPASLTDTMFSPIINNGYGMQLPRFMWENYVKGSPPTDVFVCE